MYQLQNRKDYTSTKAPLYMYLCLEREVIERENLKSSHKKIFFSISLILYPHEKMDVH